VVEEKADGRAHQDLALFTTNVGYSSSNGSSVKQPEWAAFLSGTD
jgi:hypothetical protein